MTSALDIWKMLAGIAFFLMAMEFMESSLHLLGGRDFKLFLKKQTTSKLKAMGGGAIVTAILQSSSIVNLLVLSMVGAGVVQMENALAVILGSNLGTTLNSWILATIGFNYNIENWALPIVGISGICMAFINSGNKSYQVFKFIFSLAFLFVALGYIKTGMEAFVKQTDLSDYTGYPLIAFLIIGIILTTIVQSSSATMALTLSAIHTNAITLTVATAIVLGSEIGTTIKLFIASINGIPNKKRVALGNFLFNVVTVSVLFIFLIPINHFITDYLAIKDNLIAIVFFQTFINIACILIFFPFLNLFGKFLLKQYLGNTNESNFISKVSITDTDTALEALENETTHFIKLVIDFSLYSFNLTIPASIKNEIDKNNERRTVTEKYDYIKQLQGEMHGFYLKLQNFSTNKKETERLDQLISGIRNIMYAAKNIHDAQNDIEQMRNSSNETKYNFYVLSKENFLTFHLQALNILNNNIEKTKFEEITALYQTITTGYSETLQLLYKESLTKHVNEMEISTLLNFNRALYTSFKSLLYGMKDFLLTAKEAEYFDAQSGFIR